MKSMRDAINLIDKAQEELLLEGWIDVIKDKFGDQDVNLGNNERKELSNRLYSEWKKWLGRTNREGNQEDLTRFMTHRVGFKPEDIDYIYKKSEIISDDTSTQSVPDKEKVVDNKPIDKVKEPSEPIIKRKAYDQEEGVPLPKDLNAKLSDYDVETLKKNGVEVEDSEDINLTSPQNGSPVQIDNPKDYMLTNREYDKKKIQQRLHSLPKGTKLKIGDSTFSITTNKNNTFYSESINEANLYEFSKEELINVFDVSAGRINDEYLYNGPENDDIEARAIAAKNKVPYKPKGEEETTKVGAQTLNNSEMKQILKTLEISSETFKSIEYKVDTSQSIGKMTDDDMDILSRIGYAFLKAKK